MGASLREALVRRKRMLCVDAEYYLLLHVDKVCWALAFAVLVSPMLKFA